jgi:hypothetical protein
VAGGAAKPLAAAQLAEMRPVIEEHISVQGFVP